MPGTSYISVTDQFCGAGGSSLGAQFAGCEIVLAMNHWKLAIETHNTNFPETTHVLADIQSVDPRHYPSTDILITSPECTNHSLAKGKKRKDLGQLQLFGDALFDPAEERSRATMWDVPRFAEFHNYKVIIVENVIDARRWRLFDAWIHAMTLLDYDFEIVYFNSQFAPPTPQSRDRMYVVFWKRGNRKPDLDLRPAAWCPKCDELIGAVQSWRPGKPRWGMYGRQYEYHCPRCDTEVRPAYYPAYTAIDWSLPVERIGDREKPLKPRTIERIEYGLKKYGRAVTVPLSHSHAGPQRAHPIDEPIPTQTTRQTLGMAVPPFLVHYYTRHSAHSPVDEPVPTCTGDPRFALVCPPFLAVNYGGNHARSVDDPLGTITAVDHHALICPPFLVELYGKSKTREVDEPMSAILSEIHHGLIVPFLTSVNYFDGHVRSVDESFPTQTTAPKMGLTIPFLASYYGGSEITRSVTEPMATQTAQDRHALIEPTEDLRVEDCGFRMIQPHEIQSAMAFPQDYQVLGNKRDKVRQLGNAVTPPVMQILIERCVRSLLG